MRMKITGLKVTPTQIPLVKPSKFSGGTRLSAPGCILEIETDEGITGLGEAVGPTIPLIRTMLDEEFRPFLIGQDPMRIEFITHQLEEYAINWSEMGLYGIAGVEIALLDIVGKALNTPVVNLLGGIYTPEVRFNGYLFIADPQENARDAAAYLARGFTELKMKCGRDTDFDVARLRAVRETVGPDMKIRLDANMGWSVSTAVRAIRRFEPYGVLFVEQPTPRRDLRAMAAVSRAVDVPISADEGIATIDDALKLIEARACEVFTIYVSEAGGPRKARVIADLAATAGISCVLGTWAESGVATAAALHTIGSSRAFTFASDTHYTLQADDFISVPFDFSTGTVPVPTGPGLGIALDPAKFAQYSSGPVREMVFYDYDNPAFIPRTGVIIPDTPHANR